MIRLIFVVGLVIFAFSCKKPIVLPIEPAIEFLTVRTIDTVDKLGNHFLINKINFRLIDGDGDVGNEAPDTLHNYNNTFLTMYKKNNGIFEKHILINLSLDTIPLEYRIPQLPISGGQDKALKSVVTISLETVDLKKLPFDTLKYEIYMHDRAGHISNTIETNEIIIPRN